MDPLDFIAEKLRSEEAGTPMIGIALTVKAYEDIVRYVTITGNTRTPPSTHSNIFGVPIFLITGDLGKEWYPLYSTREVDKSDATTAFLNGEISLEHFQIIVGVEGKKPGDEPEALREVTRGSETRRDIVNRSFGPAILSLRDRP